MGVQLELIPDSPVSIPGVLTPKPGCKWMCRWPLTAPALKGSNPQTLTPDS